MKNTAMEIQLFPIVTLHSCLTQTFIFQNSESKSVCTIFPWILWFGLSCRRLKKSFIVRLDFRAIIECWNSASVLRKRGKKNIFLTVCLATLNGKKWPKVCGKNHFCSQRHEVSSPVHFWVLILRIFNHTFNRVAHIFQCI